jgi:hypothetical protein
MRASILALFGDQAVVPLGECFVKLIKVYEMLIDRWRVATSGCVSAARDMAASDAE